MFIILSWKVHLVSQLDSVVEATANHTAQGRQLGQGDQPLPFCTAKPVEGLDNAEDQI